MLGVYDLDRGSADAVIAAGAHWVDSVAALAHGERWPDHLPALPAATAAVHGGGFARHARRQPPGSR